MIRNAIDWEFHVPGGIVCIHAHIYTDTVRASDAIEEQARKWLRELHDRLKAEEIGLPVEWHGKTAVGKDRELKRRTRK